MPSVLFECLRLGYVIVCWWVLIYLLTSVYVFWWVVGDGGLGVLDGARIEFGGILVVCRRVLSAVAWRRRVRQERHE